jgi:putative hydrolase of the HAD superfamily
MPQTPRRLPSVSALSFDFFDTLAAHARDRGRGRRLMAYFAANGWRSDEWVYGVLNDVFAPHGRDYDPDASDDQHREFCERMAVTVFQRLSVEAPPNAAREHALEMWNILGPKSLMLFPDVQPALTRLKAAGYTMVITSNWHCGLDGFCRAMGLGTLVDHVIASEEIGSEKPDAVIFEEVCRRLNLGPGAILHVGDMRDADYEGATRAGMHAVLIDRYARLTDSSVPSVRDLTELADLLELPRPLGGK